MKKTITLFISLLLSFISQAQPLTGNWYWGREGLPIGTYTYSQQDRVGTSVATDEQGYVYVVGYFTSNTLVLGSFTLINTAWSIFGGGTGFFVKYDPNGNVVWAQSFNNAFPNSIAIRNTNIYITGYFYYPANLGAISLTSSLGNDMFLTNFDINGNAIWAKTGSGYADDIGSSVAIDSLGNILVTGYYNSSSVMFGAVTLVNSSGYHNIFLVKYDQSGNVIWAKNYGGTDEEWSYAVSADNAGNAYVTGFFKSSSIVFGATTLLNNGSDDILIFKVDSTGNTIWAKGFGGSGEELGTSITVDQFNNIYCTGSFQSADIVFGTDSLHNSGGGYNMFINKMDASGNTLWAKSFDNAMGYSVTKNYTENIIFAGHCYNNIVYNGDTLTMTGVPSAPWFFIELDTTGNAVCSDIFECGCGTPIGISADNLGNYYFIGAIPTTSGPFVVGPDTIYSNLSSKSKTFWIGKYNCNMSPVNSNEISRPETSLSLSPNPANSSLTILSESDKIKDIHIYSALGELVYQSSLKNNQSSATINVSNLTKGMYFVEATTDKGSVRKKFIKQ